MRKFSPTNADDFKQVLFQPGRLSSLFEEGGGGGRRVEKGLIITGLFPRVKLPRCKINRRGLRRRWKLRENAAPAKEASVQGLGTISSLIDRLSCHWRGGIVVFFPPPQLYQRSLPPPPYRAVKTAVRIVPLLLALVFLEPQPWIFNPSRSPSMYHQSMVYLDYNPRPLPISGISRLV